MSHVAIIGAGPIGAAVAHRLAERARVRRVTMVDSNGSVAAGKALDIRQTGPIDDYDTSLEGSDQVLAAAGADVIVFADDMASGEIEGERGLATVQRIARSGTKAAFVFAGPRQTPLMELAARELKVPGDRMVATAGSAIVGAVASLAAIELGRTGVTASVVGRPPALVIAWSSATIAGSLVSEFVAPHRLLAISNAIPRLWPPGPQAIAAPTALVIEALVSGSRRLLHAATLLDGEFGVRGVAAMLPLELGNGRVLARVVPSLSPLEKTDVLNAL